MYNRGTSENLLCSGFRANEVLGGARKDMNTVCLSENADFRLKDKLKEKGYQLIEIQRTDAVYNAISSHVDIYVCSLKEQLVVAPEQLPLIRDALEESRISYSAGLNPLDCQYPRNIRYNAARFGHYLIHNTKYTDPVILDKAKELGLELLHVKQGYTKCSLVVVDDHSVITSDEGILRALSNKRDIEVLPVTPGHVRLEGFPYGFLGGASGRVGNEVMFNGDLSAHPDYKKIMKFISQRGLQVTYLPEYPLEDIGSIIQI